MLHHFDNQIFKTHLRTPTQRFPNLVSIASKVRKLFGSQKFWILRNELFIIQTEVPEGLFTEVADRAGLASRYNEIVGNLVLQNRVNCSNIILGVANPDSCPGSQAPNAARDQV